MQGNVLILFLIQPSLQTKITCSFSHLSFFRIHQNRGFHWKQINTPVQYWEYTSRVGRIYPTWCWQSTTDRGHSSTCLSWRLAMIWSGQSRIWTQSRCSDWRLTLDRTATDTPLQHRILWKQLANLSFLQLTRHKVWENCFI